MQALPVGYCYLVLTTPDCDTRTGLYLQFNHISDTPDFSGLMHLTDLNLSNNNIQDLDPAWIPLTVEKLNVSNNHISVIRDFSKHVNLKVMNLSGNEIIKIYDINRSIEYMEITHLHATFFDGDAGFNHLVESKFEPKHLSSPPVEVFERGLSSIRTYFTDIRTSKRVTHSRKR